MIKRVQGFALGMAVQALVTSVFVPSPTAMASASLVWAVVAFLLALPEKKESDG